MISVIFNTIIYTIGIASILYLVDTLVESRTGEKVIDFLVCFIMILVVFIVTYSINATLGKIIEVLKYFIAGGM